MAVDGASLVCRLLSPSFCLTGAHSLPVWIVTQLLFDLVFVFLLCFFFFFLVSHTQHAYTRIYTHTHTYTHTLSLFSLPRMCVYV